MSMSEVGDSWPGAGRHSGHTITLVETWPVQIEGATLVFGDDLVVKDGTITSARVECSCGATWRTVRSAEAGAA
jgi:hypothetical protein